MTRVGVDFAWQHVDPKAVGASFVCRYLSKDPTKNLSPQEANRYTRDGIDVVVVYEDGNRDCLQGRRMGQAHADLAVRQANACGMPHWAPIYFACDDDFSPGEQPAINDYFRGCADVLGTARVGGYGGFWPLKRALASRLISYVWQTAAWSGGNWLPNALEQYSFGANFDWNRTSVRDFGQWRQGESRTPPDPDWFLLPDEKHWVQVFDEFEGVRAHRPGHRLFAWGASHEAHMIRLMKARLAGIVYMANRQHDWHRLHRDLRYRALKARVDRYAKEPH